MKQRLWIVVLGGCALLSLLLTMACSKKESTEEQARQIGDAWEKLGDPKPQFNLEIHMANGDKVFKVLGPHAPNLTANEVNLLHRLWLRFSEQVGCDLHHHDVVHFALDELQKELAEGKEEEVLQRLRQHLANIQSRRVAHL